MSSNMRTAQIAEYVTSPRGFAYATLTSRAWTAISRQNVPDNIDDNDGFLVNPQGLTYIGKVLHLKTTKNSATDFWFMFVESGSGSILTMDGFGNTKLLQGNFEITTGNLKVQSGATIVTLGLNVQDGGSTIASSQAAVVNTDIISSHTAFTGSVLNVRAARATGTNFMLFQAMVGGTTSLVDIRGDGLTTVRTGGLSVITGGATIADNQVGANVLSISNANVGFTGSILSIDSTRPSQFPAADFILINGKANGVVAFTVEASGKTTIANGGLIVNGVGGAQIFNADPAAETLVVKPTSATFGNDALSIQTVSGTAHVMMKATANE
ncbi:hypothetical protein PINS_up021652 [Pythium insidiosum]|nr:hypothetical protein PINS_up021652 [Pythium insidiosum]